MKWIDSEVHLLQPEVCESGYRPPAEEDVLLRVLYDHPDRDVALARATGPACLEHMDEVGIDMAVIMGLPWRSAKRCWDNNEYVSRLMSSHPDRFIGIGILPAPGSEDLVAAVERIDESYGLRGVKVIPSWHGYRLDDPEMDPVWSEMAKRGLALVPHIDHPYLAPERSDPPSALFEVARRHPDLRCLVPHLGGMLCLYALYAPVRPVLENMSFITSVANTMRMAKFAVESVGPDRVAFGTDFPFNPTHEQGSLKAEIQGLIEDEEALRMVAGGTAAGFFGVSV